MKSELDPVGSTVHYEVMKLSTGQYRAIVVGTWWYKYKVVSVGN